LLAKGHSCYRPRRTGERKRKSVRGCIVDANLSVLALVVVRKGEQEIPGLTDSSVPSRKGPKRASNIRKLFNLSKDDDVRHYVIKRALPVKEGKPKRFKVCVSAVKDSQRRQFNVAFVIDQFRYVCILLSDRRAFAYPTCLSGLRDIFNADIFVL